MINDDTHPALITKDEAETLLMQLEEKASTRAYKSKTTYLLSGLLKTSAGDKWHGDGGTYYAIKAGTSKKRIRKDQIEEAVINKVGEDLVCDDFVNSLLAAAKKHASEPMPDESLLLQKRLKKAEDEKNRLINLSINSEVPEAMLPQIEQKELERQDIEEQLKVY